MFACFRLRYFYIQNTKFGDKLFCHKKTKPVFKGQFLKQSNIEKNCIMNLICMRYLLPHQICINKPMVIASMILCGRVQRRLLQVKNRNWPNVVCSYVNTGSTRLNISNSLEMVLFPFFFSPGYYVSTLTLFVLLRISILVFYNLAEPPQIIIFVPETISFKRARWPHS